MITRTFVILVVCFASIALADGFKTINRKEYKNVTISRVEPDGIVVRFSSGIAKIPFTEVLKEARERFHYDAQKAAGAYAEHAGAIYRRFQEKLV
jgi:hypothetical protein